MNTPAPSISAAEIVTEPRFRASEPRDGERFRRGHLVMRADVG